MKEKLAKLAWTAAGKAVSLAREALDPDVLLVRAMDAHIEAAASRYALDPGDRWTPGAPLKLLLAGYSGTRNTGADVRVEEIVRQLRHLLGDEHVDLSLLTIDPALSRGYFATVKQLHLPQFFPPFLVSTIHRQHGVVACEGSMFKSKFANALSTMMVGSLGLALAENKLAVGYGGEAGAMDPALRALVAKHCRDALVIVRNEESAAVLDGLGIRSAPGTDTAWTFEPAPAPVGEGILRAEGWDGRAPVLAVCPINPFWWPVRPDVVKGAVHAATGAHAASHYDSFYFHREGADVSEKQARYLDALGKGVAAFRAETPCFVVVVGMEQLDRPACEGLAERLGGAPLVVSDEHDMYEMVSVLRRASWLLSSRYHAIVTSMPGLVPSAGVTMDERIRNLLHDRDHDALCLGVEDRELDVRVLGALRSLRDDGEAVKDGIARAVVSNLERMGRMGMTFVEHVRERLPRFPLRAGLGKDGDPWEHLPALPRSVEDVVARAAARPKRRAASHADAGASAE